MTVFSQDSTFIKDSAYWSSLEIIEFPEVEAQFPNGTTGMLQYITANIKYPSCIDEPPDRIMVRFIIDEDGEIGNIKVFINFLEVFDDNLVGMIQNMPLWEPARVGDELVASEVRLPIIICLE